MTTVTVPLRFELTREHMLLLKAAEKGVPPARIKAAMAPDHHPSQAVIWGTWAELDDAGVARYSMFREEIEILPLGRAILDQCPLLWDEAELEAKLREMAG